MHLHHLEIEIHTSSFLYVIREVKPKSSKLVQTYSSINRKLKSKVVLLCLNNEGGNTAMGISLW